MEIEALRAYISMAESPESFSLINHRYSRWLATMDACSIDRGSTRDPAILMTRASPQVACPGFHRGVMEIEALRAYISMAESQRALTWLTTGTAGG